jgi:3-carboxy-cis,cis-muconate cycloisomerase
MPTTLIDSAIFGDIFSTDPMRRVWSDENRTQKYLDIEATLARVQARLGVIPREAAEEINRHCRIEEIDLTKLKRDTERIGYPVLGVVRQLNALCRDRLGEYCHWGTTMQDITDTATVLQMREVLALIEVDLSEIADVLAALARKHRDTPMIGRSNLQQAVPITFGYKMAALLAAVERHCQRLSELRPRVLVGEFGGACGTLASLQKGALETQAGLTKELELGVPEARQILVVNRQDVGSFDGQMVDKAVAQGKARSRACWNYTSGLIRSGRTSKHKPERENGKANISVPRTRPKTLSRNIRSILRGL